MGLANSRIVFIQPNVGFKGHAWEALGVGYLISYLKKHYSSNLETDFYSGFYDTDEAIIKGCEDADIIGFSCTSPQWKHAYELAKQIKRSSNRIVVGGIHATALPKEVSRCPYVDAVVVGEGEQPLLQAVNNHPETKGIYTHTPIANLDELPFPDRAAIKNERNIQQAYRDNGKRITSILTSRGCPFQCSFCCSHVLWGRKPRYRSSANILAEMDYLERVWHIEFIKFADDTFTVNRNRVLNFCALKKDMGIPVPFGANAHVNTVDAQVLHALVDCGCQELWFGVESGSPRILQAMHKNTTINQVKKVFALAKDCGIRTRAYFLLGMPMETREDIALTEQLCDELEPDQVGFTLLAPFPINEHYRHSEMSRWDWSQFDEYGNNWVRTETLSNQELKEIQARLVEKYQRNMVFRQRKVVVTA